MKFVLKLISHHPLSADQGSGPSSNTFREILLTSLKCPNLQRAIAPEIFDGNQVIYSSSSISWPSFKLLAQILSKISCWQDFILIFSKAHNSRKGDNSEKKKKEYKSAIFPWGIHIWSFKTLACKVHEESIHVHKICIKKFDERMHAWTTQNQYAPSTSSKLGA